MPRKLAFLFLVCAFAEVRSDKDPEADFRKLPKLFHLDDYERCLERKDGIYCLGIFDVYSDVQPNPIYDIIQEKSQDIRLYNRSYLHRGYCLPTRCPSSEVNETTRFEHCVDTWAREHGLRTRLQKLYYCRAHGQPRPLAPDTSDLPHRVFLYFVYTLLVMAVVGTVYDMFIAIKGRKNPLLTSFSVRINWKHLTSNYQDVDPRLRELEVFHVYRFLMGLGLVLCHVYILTAASYQHNPRFVEKLLSAPGGFIMGSSMTFTLKFILMSNFLTSYNILLLSKKKEYSLKLFPLLVIKRVVSVYYRDTNGELVAHPSVSRRLRARSSRLLDHIMNNDEGRDADDGATPETVTTCPRDGNSYKRHVAIRSIKTMSSQSSTVLERHIAHGYSWMYPVYLLLNGFAATWWKSMGDGPLWPVLLGAESDICRKKFWITAAFLQNFIQKKDLCLVQTWIMAVDIQLHLLTLFMTLVLLKYRQHAVKVLSALLVVATAMLAHKTFEEDLIPTYLYTTPEVYRNIFDAPHGRSFFDLYIHPMNGAISAIAGTMLAFIHMDHQERDIKMSRSKVLVALHYLTVFTAEMSWMYAAYAYFRHYDHWTQNLMVIIERLVVCMITSFIFYSIVNHKGFVHYMVPKRGLRMVARLSFSMSMCHWCILILLYTDRWTLHDSSFLRIISDSIVVYVLAHVVAVPLTLLVEYPLQKFFDRLINVTGHRWFSPLKAKAQ